MKLKDIKPEMVSKNGETGKWEVVGLPSEPLYDHIIGNLKNKRPFSFSRYGDGEIGCLLGKSGSNCDNHEYFPNMGEALKRIVLSQPEYLMGLQPLSMLHKMQEIKEFAGHLDIDWVNSDVLHDANIEEKLSRFFNVLKGEDIIMVAPERLRSSPIEYTDFIEIPLLNCWLESERVEKELLQILPQRDYCVILFCASMSTNVMIDNMYKYYGDKVTMIDLGSCLDPFCGYNTRSYHSKLGL